ncbi:MAG: hypothetical protein VCC04_07450 [Myxococcota bacterium]
MLEKFRWLLAGASALGTAFVLFPAQPASATQVMTGSYEMHNGFSTRRRINVNTGVAVSAGGGFTVPSKAFSTMGTPVAGKATFFAQCPPASATGFCPYIIAAKGFQAFPGFPLYAQVASTYTEYNEGTYTLKPGSGPGTLAFCPVVGNPANGAGTKPACAALGSFGGAQGIVQYTAGANQFGGTMAIARRTATVEVSFRLSEVPLKYQHDIETRAGNWMVGVDSKSTFTTQPGQLTPADNRGRQTTGPVLGSYTSILTQGVLGINGAQPLPSSSTGFPWTTGMVRVAEDSCLANPFQACNATAPTPNAATIGVVQFTNTGMDARVGGIGNITLVAGGVFQNRGSFSTGNWGVLNLNMGATVPSMSRWGLVSVALVIPLVGLWIARSRLKK